MPRQPRKTRVKNPSKSGRPPKSARNLVNQKPDGKILLAMHRDMLLIRRFEEKAGQLYGMGKIGVFVTFTLVKRLSLLDCNL